MIGWHHQLTGHEFEQTLGDGEGQGSLMCCSPWSCKELDTTEQLNKTQSEGLPMWLRGKEPTCQCMFSLWVGRSPGEGNDNHSAILAWEIPLTEKPCGLQYVESQKSQTQLCD